MPDARLHTNQSPLAASRYKYRQSVHSNAHSISQRFATARSTPDMSAPHWYIDTCEYLYYAMSAVACVKYRASYYLPLALCLRFD